MIWQPLREDVAPFEAGLSRLVRALILADPEGQAEPVWMHLPLPGREARVRMSARPERPASHGGRMVLIYQLAGQAVIGREGFACRGTAALDLKTRAFLDVTCRLQPLGPSLGVPPADGAGWRPG